jgi:hypothetical protein
MYKEWKSFEDHSFPYLTGNSFAVNCKHIWNYDNYKINSKSLNSNWVFIKTDYVQEFFTNVKINEPIIVFTHNSDYPINESFIKYLDDPRVILWFAQNAGIEHPKLKTIPIGIANAGYSHGDIEIVNKIRNENNVKVNMFYTNFNISNNRTEREYCLNQTGLSLMEDVDGGWTGFAGGYKLPTTFEGYLRDLSKTYFSISPKGNGIDCHRTWESLYMGCIPVVTKSKVVTEHKDMPIIILEDWSQFKEIEFTKELYYKIWNNFNIGDLHMDNYLKRIRKQILEHSN